MNSIRLKPEGTMTACYRVNNGLGMDSTTVPDWEEYSGVDPELLLGGGTNPLWGRHPPNIMIIISEKP